jgi:hypothetical protein
MSSALSPTASDRRRWWGLIVLAVAQLTLLLDATVVNVALAPNQQDLRRVFLIGLALASALGGLAGSPAMLVLSRVLHGVGGALVAPAAQEEPKNQGAWSFLRGELELPGGKGLSVVSRPASAAPATGSRHRHQKEQSELVRRVLDA